MLPKIVKYGLVPEEEVLDIIERRLRDELIDARGVLPLNWLMIGQWARKPQTGRALSNPRLKWGRSHGDFDDQEL